MTGVVLILTGSILMMLAKGWVLASIALAVMIVGVVVLARASRRKSRAATKSPD